MSRVTAAEAGSSPADQPSRSFEVERKFDVDNGVPVPDWSGLNAVASVSPPALRELDARYYDTADLALAGRGFAVRRRTGGPDAGWHVKGPHVGGGRVELGWPLGAEDESIPDAVRAELPVPTDAALQPIARIRNARTAYALRAPNGSVVAEFVDDSVVSTDERSGAERSWREWEIELGPSAPADPREFFGQVEAAVLAAGGRPAASASKLARALGY
jgi:inorganic triphosphatase YgiF